MSTSAGCGSAWGPAADVIETVHGFGYRAKRDGSTTNQPRLLFDGPRHAQLIDCGDAPSEVVDRDHRSHDRGVLEVA
jgi:hypothetical protein